MSADDGGFALRCAAYEEFVGVGLTASSLGYPGDTGLGLGAVDKTVGGWTWACPACGGPCTCT
jgi:hypothetical protein